MLASLLTFLERPFRSSAAVRPMLLRLSQHVGATVDLSVSWDVGTEEVRATHRLYVSDGVCLLPWRHGAISVSIATPTGPGARLLKDAYRGEVVDLG